MIIDQTNFLDWKGIIINEIVGSPLLFFAIACVILFIVCSYNRVPSGTMLILFVLWTFVFLAILYVDILIVIVICILCFLAYKGMMRLIGG